MNHKGTVELETERLVLRKFKLEDAKEMFNNWASDEEVTKYLTWEAHKNIKITKSVLSEWVESYSNLDFYQWGIVIKDTNELIGSIGVVGHKENRLICDSFAFFGRKVGFNRRRKNGFRDEISAIG